MAAINGTQKVVWDPVTSAVEYRVRLLNAGAVEVAVYNVVVPEITAEILFAGMALGSYSIRVVAKDAGGVYGAEAILALTYNGLPAPENLRVE